MCVYVRESEGTRSKSNVYRQFAHRRPNPRRLRHERIWTEYACVEMISARDAGKGERLAFFGREVLGL